jgi:cyclopropane-fatty-acyl-phospholipid synthase
MITKDDVIQYYADKSNGVHRYNTEAFFELEAKEKLFHMGAAESILDFGCGTADLLAYYAPHYAVVLGVDLSDNMVARANQRLAKFGFAHARARQADETTVWAIDPTLHFDVITSAGVMQYLSEAQIASFLAHAKERLTDAGRITMFDLVDPRLYWLMKYGWFRNQPLKAADLVSAAGTTGRIWARKAVRALSRKAEDHIGFSHHPAAIESLASREGFSVQIVRSMYYEYRYHVLLRPNR